MLKFINTRYMNADFDRINPPFTWHLSERQTTNRPLTIVYRFLYALGYDIYKKTLDAFSLILSIGLLWFQREQKPS